MSPDSSAADSDERAGDPGHPESVSLPPLWKRPWVALIGFASSAVSEDDDKSGTEHSGRNQTGPSQVAGRVDASGGVSSTGVEQETDVDFNIDIDLDEVAPPRGSDKPLTEIETFELLRPACRRLAHRLEASGYEVVETYWLIPPFAYSAVLRDPHTGDYQYFVVEPVLSEGEEALRGELDRHLQDDLLFRTPPPGSNLVEGLPRPSDGQRGTHHIAGDHDAEPATRTAALEAAVASIIDRYDLTVTELTRRKLLYYLRRDWLEFGPVDPLMHDPRIEEISCDGNAVPVFVHHRDYESLKTNVSFDATSLRAYVTKLAQRSGKDLSLANPLEGAALSDGSRIELSLGHEVTPRGSTFTIRKFKEDPFTPIDLVSLRTFTLDQLAYLWVCIENNLSCLIAGGTASGKTTTLNACSVFIPPKAKIVSIEDTRELTLPHANWVPTVTRPAYTEGDTGIDMMTLLRHALRHRPEHIIVGEVRGEEAHTLFQAMNTGHTTYSTIHADTVRGVLNRLENPPMSVEKELISALDVVVLQTEAHVDGERVRRLTDIAELYDLDPEDRTIETRSVFRWDELGDTFDQVHDSRHLERLASHGRHPYDEIEYRKTVLQYLIDNEITQYEAVAAVAQAYMLAPEHVRSQVEAEALDLDMLRQLRARAVGEDPYYR